MKNLLQKARLLLTSVEHSKYFTLILIFLIALTAGIVIIASQGQKELNNISSNETTKAQFEETQDSEPLYGTTTGSIGTANLGAKCVKGATNLSYFCKEGLYCEYNPLGGSYGTCKKIQTGGGTTTGSYTPACDTSACYYWNPPQGKCLYKCTSGQQCLNGVCTSCKKTVGSYAGSIKCLDCNYYAKSKYRCDGTTYFDNYDKVYSPSTCKTSSACTSGGTTKTTPPPSGGGTGGTTGGGITGNTSCSRCSDTYKNVKANWQEGDSTCDRSNVIGSTTYSLDCTCINDTQYGKKATRPSSDKNIDSSKCSPRCSDTYGYCKTEWNCTTPDCSDTWNAKYVKDCSCTQGTSNCNTKGVDTSSCTTSSTLPESTNPFDCSGTKDGHNWKCDTTCNTADGWSSSAYNNMPEKTTCQKDSKICCKQNITTAPQIPDCDNGIQYGECTGAQTNTCSQDNGTRTVTYTTHTSGGQCNQKSLYSQACTQNNCSFNYTCNSGRCVTVTTGGGNTGGGGNTNPQPTTPTVLTFNLGLDGIGSAGDHINPDATDSNKNPKTTVRKITVSVLDSTGTKAENTIDASYNTGLGKLSVSVDLGTSFSTGVYTIKAKSDGYLRKNLSTTQNITAGQANALPDTNLIVGDINNDNTISVLDYNILISCSLFSKDNGDLCSQNGTNKTLSDLDDDGTVNQYDYSLFVREFSAQKGD